MISSRPSSLSASSQPISRGLSTRRRLVKRYEATTSTAKVVTARAWYGKSGMPPLLEVVEAIELVDCPEDDVVTTWAVEVLTTVDVV